MNCALITGASSGIGAEFCRQLDNANLDQIWVVARRTQRLEALATQLCTPVRVCTADLSTPQGVESIAAQLEEQRPHITWLINNAGFGKLGDFGSIALEHNLDMVNLNARAVVHLTWHAIPYLHRGSFIVNVSSSAGFAPLGGFGIYAATKAFVNSFSLSLRAELAPRGIGVTAVCPGPVDTEFNTVAFEGSNRAKGVFNRKAPTSAIVALALRDTRRGKAYSLYGPARLVNLAARCLPSALIARLSCSFLYRTLKGRRT